MGFLKKKKKKQPELEEEFEKKIKEQKKSEREVGSEPEETTNIGENRMPNINCTIQTVEITALTEAINTIITQLQELKKLIEDNL